MGSQSIGTLELMLLLTLMRLADDAYGVAVATELKAVTGKAVSLGAVYATLERLEGKSFVASHTGDPTPERGGRAKRYFRVTNEGLRAVQETQRSLASLAHGIPHLKQETA